MSKPIPRPSKEEVIDYYINTTVTAAEAAKHFGMSEVVFRRLLRAYDVHKSPEMIAATHDLVMQTATRKYAKLTKEQLVDLYITQNKTKKECCEIIGCSQTQFSRYLKEHDILKPKELKQVFIDKNAAEKSIAMPSAEEIREFYFNPEVTAKDAAKHFGVSLATFERWQNKLNIFKPKDIALETISRGQTKMWSDPERVKQISDARRQTCLERYGVDNPSKCPEVVQKIIDSESIFLPKDELYQKYIVEGFSQQACAEHFNCERSVIYNNLQRYGFTKTPEQISEHRRNTCMKKYGFASPVQSPEIQERVKQNSLQKYGAPNPAQAHIEHKDILFSQEKFTEWLKSLDKKPSVYFLRDFFKTSWHAVVSRVREYGVEDLIDIAPLRSHYEDEIIDFLKKLGITNIEPNNRKILGRQEIDIYLPDYKFGIEFNGIYFHSDLSSKYQDHGGRSTRHQEKSLLAEEKGVFLFHIFEHEWDDSFLRKNENLNLKVNILNRIQTLLGLNVVTIGARKCEIREISKQDKNNFLDKNHIQGKEKHSQYAFGLYYQDELVACMTFGKSKFKKYDWELMRFCTKQGINVSGGASRLFQYFLNNYVASGETIVSYNDITKTKGTLYQTLGFELQSINRPNYWWINLDTKEVKSRYETQIPNESKVMHDAGFCRICDCGTKTWLYTKK